MSDSSAVPQRLSPTSIITSHSNPDFDALASIVAASKLYPDAVLIAPGGQDKSLRNFFMESATYLFNFKQARDVDFSQVTQLIVVDTRQRSRISHVAKVLENPQLQIELWDHHPDSDDDLPATWQRVESWGSTASILIDAIQQRGISLTAEEATILGLGLYEDTGSFTFNSTTVHDLQAAAWLLSQGMELDTINELVSRELSSEQISVLNALLESSTRHIIRGVPVVFAETSMDSFMGDFSTLAHKMMDIENIKVLVTLARMGDRVQVVARSRLPQVDVGAACKALGGGGHAYAASASVKDKMLQEVRDEMFRQLYLIIHPEFCIADLMSAHVKSVDNTQSVAEAEEIMNHFGFKAIPIVEHGTRRCVGYLEHQTAARAIAHKLGAMNVSEYMQRQFLSVKRTACLKDVMQIIIGHRQRLVPVLADVPTLADTPAAEDTNAHADKNAIISNEAIQSDIIGVVTRTDLIKAIVEEPARIPDALLSETIKERTIGSLIREQLPKHITHILQLAGQLGDRNNVSVYVVGGFVRDLLLRRANLDIDLVVEDDGIRFARKLAQELGGRIREHAAFKTAIVIYSDEEGHEQRIDVATARLEYYEYPAALPTVELSSIKMDLFRRDFTINALAVQLNKERFGRLVDFFNAQRDVKERAIRVLHSLSFVEDPTRILRAIRFEQRYAFHIGIQTCKLIKNALELNLIEQLSNKRLAHELDIIFQEQTAVDCIKRMEEMTILHRIHPELSLTPTKTQLLESIEQVLVWYHLLYLPSEVRRSWLFLLGLCTNSKYQEASDVVLRLDFSPSARQRFLSLREKIRKQAPKIESWLHKKQATSVLCALLDTLELEGILYIMARARNEELRKHVSLYLTTLQHIRLDISGNDILALGLPAGPEYAQILQHIRNERLDGNAPDRPTQLALAQKLVQEIKNVTGEHGKPFSREILAEENQNV